MDTLMTANPPATAQAPRILLAEDEEAMRTYLERALTNAGYAVTSVDRGTDDHRETGSGHIPRRSRWQRQVDRRSETDP